MNSIRYAVLFALVVFVFSGELSGVEPSDQPDLQPPVVEQQRVWDIIRGGGWIMVPLGAISIWCLALVIESFVRIRLSNFAPPEIIPPLRDAFARENYQEAWRVCRSRPSFLTNTLRSALESIGQGRQACAQALADHALKESMLYRTKVSYLSTIGVVSPMVGLLGTVTGMVKAFQTLRNVGVDAHLLAGAIGEVLIATATGLMVAIPAFFMYYFFRNRLQSAVVLAEDIVNQLLRRVKYEELQGIMIGEDMELAPAEGVPPQKSPPKSGISQRISQPVAADAVACPQCHAPIRTGVPACPNCGIELQWEIPPAQMQHQTA
jgi:biopolymer transport protein ExbB